MSSKNNRRVLNGVFWQVYVWNQVLSNEKEKRKAHESNEIEKDLTKLNVTGGHIEMQNNFRTRIISNDRKRC